MHRGTIPLLGRRNTFPLPERGPHRDVVLLAAAKLLAMGAPAPSARSHEGTPPPTGTGPMPILLDRLFLYDPWSACIPATMAGGEITKKSRFNLCIWTSLTWQWLKCYLSMFIIRNILVLKYISLVLQVSPGIKRPGGDCYSEGNQTITLIIKKILFCFCI